MRGKRGNSVYYKLTNSNNKETQGERAYVGKVANPKTLQQAIQRVKLAPAVNFYRAFKKRYGISPREADRLPAETEH